jgi:hypothetical protein
MTVTELGTRRVTIPDGTAYELVSFDMQQAGDRGGLHHVTTSAFDRENQFLFEVGAPPCAQHEISASRAQSEQHAEDRLGSHVWSPGESDRLEPSTPAGA